MPRAAVAAPPPKLNISVEQAPQSTAPSIPAEPPEEKSPTEFWDYLQEIPRDKWGSVHDLMGWRMDPKVPGVPGAKGFLFQVAEPITPMWMKQHYGGGKFRVILQRNSKWFKTHEFEIEGSPKYDLTRENPNGVNSINSANANTAGNDALLKILEEQIRAMREQITAMQTQDPTSGNERSIDLVAKGAEKAMDMMAKQAPAAQNGTTQLAELVTIIKGLMPQPQASPLEGLLAPVLKELAGKLAQPVDPMAQITMFLTIFEKLDALRGGGGSDSKPKDWKAMLAEGAVQRGPEILKELRETFQVNKEAAEARMAAAQANARTMEIARTMPGPGARPVTPTNVGTPTPQPSPAAPHVNVGPFRVVPIDGSAPPTNVGAPTPPTPPPAAPGMSASESDAVANWTKRKIVEMVSEHRDPEDLVEFLEDVDHSVNDLIGGSSIDLVKTFLSGDPILAQLLELPKIDDYLDEMQDYIQRIRKEDEAIEAEATRVPN